jgi:hypothetical protein
LANQFKPVGIKVAFAALIGKVGGSALTALYPCVSTNVHPKAKKRNRAVKTLENTPRRVHIIRAMWRMLFSRIYLVVI